MAPLRNTPRLSELSEHLLRLPTMDRGTFATLTSVPDIQAWTTAKADEYRQFVLALLAIHNLAAPIHRLPTEVLERILEQCWDDWESLRLPHVCRLWRSILLGSPAFWADAVANCEFREKRDIARNELPLVDALLSRSTRNSHTIDPSFYTFTPLLAQSLTPHISNVVSLEMAVGKGDLHERLWPLFLSGMPNLEALEIQPMITKEDLSGYNEDEHGDLADWYSDTWTSLPMLSRKALPKLSRLTCPHNMIERFGDVSLRHLKVEWWDRAQETFQMPIIGLGEHGGLYLEPYRDSLETLEYVLAWGYARSEKAFELPSLRYLYINSGTNVVSQILSWLLLPQTTVIHIDDFAHFCARDSTKLRSIVGAIDRVCLQQLPRRPGWEDYRMECYAGDIRRLRIDNFVTRDGLLEFFGEEAPITRLILSVSEPTPNAGGQAVDLRAFPHLVHLDACGRDMETVARMLQPNGRVQREGQPQAAPLLCPSLAELVVDIPCGFVDRSAAASSPGGRTTSESSPCGSDAGADVDESFRQKSAELQRLLADRASAGGRLTSLAFRLRPSTIPDSEPPGSGSKDSADGGAAKTSVIWPSRAVRESVVQSLKELIDGPVTFLLRRPNWWRDVYR